MIKNNTPIQKRLLIISVVTAVGTGLLLQLFNSGKIIDIPKGAHEGGIITVIGYGIIVIIVPIIAMAVLGILKKRYSK